MTRKSKPYWQIEMAAENMLRQCDCFDKPYRYIDFMIESCKIDLIPLDIKNDKLLGLFGRDNNGNKFIGFNKDVIPERILFTKAHELGHFVLEHKLNGEFLTDSDYGNKDPQETEANVFAAALLMPKKNVVKVVEETIDFLNYNNETFDFNDLNIEQWDYIIKQMRQMFHTSKQSIEFRLKDIILRT